MLERRLTAIAAAAAFALAAAALPAQEGEEPAAQGAAEAAGQGTFVDTVEVTVVNVDVYVTDKQGNRITGLTRDDFEIYEDGRPVAITNFYAVEDGQPVIGGPVAPEPLAPAEAAPAAPPERPAPPEDQRLYLVVYIDNFNLRPPNRNRVMRELRTFLRERLDRDDRVMLVTYDRSLHVRRPLTSDPEAIASAMLELEKVSGHAVHRDSERRETMRRIEEAGSVSEAMSWVRTYAGSLYNDLAFTIDALREIVDGLVGLPGRKAVLYVSDGIQMIAGEDLFYAVQTRFGDSSALTEQYSYDSSRRFRELTAAANTGRVTFYTIDAAGLRTFSYIDASNQTPGGNALIDQVYVSSLQSPLLFMAEKTGGKAIINANRVLPDLEQVAADFETYYSLGFTPSHAGDGRLHRIEVKVAEGKGLRVRHREDYRDKSPNARMADGTRAALLHDQESNVVGLALDFGDPSPAEKGRFLVPLQVRIPIANLVLVPNGEAHEARLRLFVAVMDSDGDTSEVQEVPVPVSIPDPDLERAREQEYHYRTQLLMRGGWHRVSIGLRDEVGAESSFITRTVNVGGR